MPKAPFQTPASYEAALEELEQLVGLIESGQLPLEQLLDRLPARRRAAAVLP